MRALYLDCFSGISGNMFFAAMADLGLDTEGWRAALSRLPLPETPVVLEPVRRSGIRALYGDVKVPYEHAHRGLGDVLEVIAKARLDAAVTRRAETIFRRLAEAEAEVHGVSVEEVHFHEVGAIDAIVDVLSAAYFLEASGAERVLASPVCVGFGRIRAAHGVMPVPAPATALLLRGVPTYGGDVEGELTTPTGAAILAASVDAFGPQPLMRVEKIGWGAGTRELEHQPNCLRVLLGDLVEEPAPGRFVEERLLEVECHIDDMRGEDLAFLVDTLLEGPAVDVLLIPAQGKKGRPAHIVRVLAPVSEERAVLEALFQGSTTLGARVRKERRIRLEREETVVETALGPVRAKRVGGASGLSFRPEYDDLAALARRRGVSLAEARAAFLRAADALARKG